MNNLYKIGTNKPIYNGLTIRQIIKRFNPKMIKQHKKLYLNNCIQVYFNEQNKVNLLLNEQIKNENFNLTLFYLNIG